MFDEEGNRRIPSSLVRVDVTRGIEDVCGWREIKYLSVLETLGSWGKGMRLWRSW